MLQNMPMGRVLFGSQEAADAIPAAKRVVDRLGTFDEHLFDAKRIERYIQDAGGSLSKPLTWGTDKDFFDAELPLLREVSSAMPGLMRQNPEDAAKSLKALREAGVDLTDEQFEALSAARASRGHWMEVVKDAIIGEAPVETLKQRYRQGGILGKGGVLMSELPPPAALRRTTRRMVDATRRGDYREAAKEILPTVGRGAMWGGGAYMGYAVPVASAKETYNLAQEAGVSAPGAVAANLAASAIPLVVGPMGASQALAYGPGTSAMHKLLGAPTLGELEGMVAKRRRPAGGPPINVRVNMAGPQTPGRQFNKAAPPARSAPATAAPRPLRARADDLTARAYRPRRPGAA